jgi:hypothetical protein
MATVSSVLSESTTMISSATGTRLFRQSSIFFSSLKEIIQALIFGMTMIRFFLAIGSAGPVY